MSKYRKKPVIIDAIQWNGNNFNDICGMMNDESRRISINRGTPEITIGTLEGNMKAKIGDWIIKGVNGEMYPCKDDIFQKTYEVVA